MGSRTPLEVGLAAVYVHCGKELAYILSCPKTLWEAELR
jgi:hypothetical protein